MKKINIAVIFGGQSGEHEVSLSSAQAVMKNLNQEKYRIIPIAITKGGNWLIGEKGAQYLKNNSDKLGKEGAISLEKSQSLVTLQRGERSLLNFTEGDLSGEKIDRVFPLIHGPFGEDGRLQGMLDMLGVPYVFSGVLAHALGMNKPKAKVIAKNFGVSVAKDLVLKKENYTLENILEKIDLPVVIKPAELGSSVGISIAKTETELEKGIADAFRYGSEVLLEQYIKGRELTVTVMGNADPKVLAITEIIPLISEFYDYKAKYETGGSRHICPAEIPVEFQKKLEAYAIKTFQAIGCADLARVDFMYDEKNSEAYFIDINTVPGMTPTSLAPEAARQAGMGFPVFLDELISGALLKK
ncbi:MAG: D-alanine--D-alanine ligase family protein [Parcubacteria group bacterium]|jgi:D-alanine-D-alanine ligase